ncbi:hypothetical protein PIB30_006980 [Stylosanthes scabra]|uniref:Uncharacterized protein n=1 Tax=Stylosanthes scabra TaxID=79078 RepID=A0ABU6Z2Y0_9FABA|nr:hypothetical protein [Stylosanthes scabra]
MSLFGEGLTTIFIGFYYEKKEEEINELFMKALSFGCKLKSDAMRKLLSSKKSE